MIRVATWWRAHIVVPRWALTFAYVLFSLVGLILFVVPSALDEVGGVAARLTWAALMVLTALAAAVGSLSMKLEPLERWASATLTALVLFSVVITATVGRLTAGLVILVALILVMPGSRALLLASRAGRNRDRG